MSTRMRFIRKEVLGLTQVGMARVAGVTQGTISKWESGELEPGLTEIARIRAEAARMKKRWRDAWLFAPHEPQRDSSEAA